MKNYNKIEKFTQMFIVPKNERHDYDRYECDDPMNSSTDFYWPINNN